MTDTARLCMKCMTNGLSPGGVCERCVADERALWAAPHRLRPRTVLAGRYPAGQVIGEGGFGITYVGWDTALSLKVAIKEYYPTGFVTRDAAHSAEVRSFGGDKAEIYARGRSSFVNVSVAFYYD